jgi:hypothetical protein
MSNMCGAFVTNPVNVIKVRMQLNGASSSATQVNFAFGFDFAKFYPTVLEEHSSTHGSREGEKKSPKNALIVNIICLNIHQDSQKTAVTTSLKYSSGHVLLRKT